MFGHGRRPVEHRLSRRDGPDGVITYSYSVLAFTANALVAPLMVLFGVGILAAAWPVISKVTHNGGGTVALIFGIPVVAFGLAAAVVPIWYWFSRDENARRLRLRIDPATGVVNIDERRLFGVAKTTELRNRDVAHVDFLIVRDHGHTAYEVAIRFAAGGRIRIDRGVSHEDLQLLALELANALDVPLGGVLPDKPASRMAA